MIYIYCTRVISTRRYYSFWGFLEPKLFSKIKEVTKGADTIQERVLITPVRYVQSWTRVVLQV